MDRNQYISHDIKKYYINFFPKQIFFGIHNTLYKLSTNSYIYNTDNMIIDKYIKVKIPFIKKNFFKINLIKHTVYAHETTNMFEKNYSYKYITFKKFNKINHNNLNKFPYIKDIITKFPNIRTCFISIMSKSLTIPFHRGPYNGILRYHIPIYIKNPSQCYIQVLNTKLYYKNSFMFDDTYPHKLVKLDDELRVVLICDIDNPYSIFLLHKYLNV